jgi:O-antigen/teichoic acid export membrane protein
MSLRGLLPKGYLDLAKVMGGTLGRNLLRGLLKLLIPLYLAPRAFGVLRSIYSFFRLLATAADLGLDYATITLVSAAIKKRETRDAERLLKTVLTIKLLVAGALLVVGNLLAPRIAVWALSDVELTVYVRVVFLALGGQLIWRFLSSYLTTRQAFGRLALFLTTVPLLMLLAAGTLMLSGRFDLHAAILIYLLAPTVTVILWWPALDRGFTRGRGPTRAIVGRILRFSRWVYLSDVASSCRGHVNPLLLKSPLLSGSVVAGEANAGLYGFGNDLANEITVFSQSLVTVMLPKASRKTTGPALRRFVKRSYRHLLLLLIPLALLLFAARPFLLGLGRLDAAYLAYLPSLKIFAILYGGALFTVAAIPMRTALYSMNLPAVETTLDLVTVPLMVGAAVLLIPRYGGVGAALAVLAQRAVSCVALSAIGLAKLRVYDPQPEA